MTYEQFWDGDVEIARYYRKAYQLKLERDNEAAWWQGLYIYEAICDASPVLRAFSKAKKPADYSKEPYPITEAQLIAKREREQKLADLKFREYMNAVAANFNKRFEAKQKEGYHHAG